jgi:hypothetical protein
MVNVMINIFGYFRHCLATKLAFFLKANVMAKSYIALTPDTVDFTKYNFTNAILK